MKTNFNVETIGRLWIQEYSYKRSWHPVLCCVFTENYDVFDSFNRCRQQFKVESFLA